MKADLERFLRNAHIFARLVEQVLEDGYIAKSVGAKLTFGQLNILKFLARPGRKLIKDVARFLNSSYAAASKAVSRLERKKMVRTTPWGEDGRAEWVQLTSKAVELVRTYEKVKAERLQAVVRGEDVEFIAKGLEQGIGLLLRERAVAGNPCLGCGVYYSQSCAARLFGKSCPIQEEQEGASTASAAPPR